MATPPPPPAGWYPDPDFSTVERFWDGTQWTEAKRDPQDVPVQSSASAAGYGDATRWSMIVAGILMAVGSFLPWVSAGLLSLAGIEGDGVFTLIAGVIVAVIGIANRPKRVRAWVVVVASSFGGWIVIQVGSNFDLQSAGSGSLLEPAIGTGLFVSGLGALIGAIAGLAAIPIRER